jgi:hypothetical protein
MSAMVGLMSAQDLERGLEIARTAGELWAVSDVVDTLEMPVLSGFLESRGESLQVVAVDVMLAAVGARALSVALSEEARRVADLGTEEAAEGLARLAVSAGLAGGGEELGAAGARLAAEGLAETEAGLELGQAAREMAVEGVAEIAEGAAELGAATSEAAEGD